jgi:hypothetical protein
LRALRLLALAALSLSCITKRVPRPKGTQSFRITRVSPMDDAAFGTLASPLPYAAATSPFAATLRVEAIDWAGQPDRTFSGHLLLDARPGQVYPNEMDIKEGVGEVSIQLANSYGETRVWFEHCGQREAPLRGNCTDDERKAYLPECMAQFKHGTLATGISPPVIFAQPSISDVQGTTDSGTSPLQPFSGDRCAALADPRYVDTGNLTPAQITQLPRGQRIPASGNTVKITAGEMIVTAIDNGGFFLTDVSDAAKMRGFNGIYVFNFNYPENLQVGDRVTSITGTPAEFTGSTQLANPYWTKDLKGPFLNRIPVPTRISTTVYEASVSASGSNISNAIEMEKLEGGLVCMEGLVIPSGAENCDRNNDGSVTRGAGSEEQACETACYQNPDCFEASSYFAFGNWGAYIPQITSSTYKIGLDMAGAFPDFRPDKYMRDPELYDSTAKDGDAPKTLAVIGNLVHVLGARPVWVIQPRGKDDVRFGGTCP